jgi:hypothetical protein
MELIRENEVLIKFYGNIDETSDINDIYKAYPFLQPYTLHKYTYASSGYNEKSQFISNTRLKHSKRNFQKCIEFITVEFNTFDDLVAIRKSSKSLVEIIIDNNDTSNMIKDVLHFPHKESAHIWRDAVLSIKRSKNELKDDKLEKDK